MAKGKKGKKKGKDGGDRAKPVPLKNWEPFTASTLLAQIPIPAGAKGKKGKQKDEDAGSSKTEYGRFDREIFVASAAGLYPGGMMMVGGEAVQVLEVGEEARKKDDRPDKHQKGVKLVVRRACMGTLPKPHTFETPVLALPGMVSHRPGTSPAAIRSHTPVQGKDIVVRAKSGDGDGGVVEGLGGGGKLNRVTKWFEDNRRDLIFGLHPRHIYCKPLEEGTKDMPAQSPSGNRNFENVASDNDTENNAHKPSRLQGSGWQPVFPYSTPVSDVLAPHRNPASRCMLRVNRAPTDPLDRRNKLVASTVKDPAIPKEMMLMYAVKHGHIQTVEQLLLEGLDANMLCMEAKSKFQPKASMLIIAAEEGRANIVELLIRHKGNILLQAENDSALTVAKSGLESVRHVLKKKIQEHEAAEERKKQEEAAARERKRKEEEERMERLASLARTKSVLSRSNSGVLRSRTGSAGDDSAGSEALKEDKEQKPVGSAEQVKIDEFLQIIAILRQEYVDIIRCGRSPGNCDTRKYIKDKIMRLGIEEGWPELVEAAIVHGGMSANHTFSISNPGSSSWSSSPAVQLAASHGRASVLKILLQLRATVQVSDVDGCTPLMYAARSGTAECAKVSRLRNATFLHSRYASVETRLLTRLVDQLLLDAGAGLEVKGPNGTAVHEAVCHSNADVLSVLMKAGARVGDKHNDGLDSVMRAWTMAHGAATKGDESAAGATLEVFHTFFRCLAETGREETCDAYCYVALGCSVSGPWFPGVRSSVFHNSTSPAWDEVLELRNRVPGSGEMVLSSMFVKVEVWDWDQVGDELRIGSFVLSLNAIAHQPNSTLAGAFSILSSAEISAPSADGRCNSPRSPATGVSPKTAASSPQGGRSELLAGILNVKLQVMTSTLVVHLKDAERLEPQDRQTKHIGDCLKTAALAGWCDIIAICAAKGGDFNTSLDGGRHRYALMYAAATQKVDVLRMLLNADLCARNDSTQDQAAVAPGQAHARDDNVQRECSHQPANPNLADSDGVTALMWACAGRIIVPRSAKMSSDEEATLDETERQLCQLRIGYGAAEYVPESGDPADLDLRSRYEAHEKKAEHDRLLKQLQLRYPGLILLRHRTVEALLLAGANPTQKEEKE